MIKKVLDWAKKEKNVQALILTGSRAEKRKIDELSDYDIAVICKDYTPYTKNNDWILELKKFCICIPEKLSFFDKYYPTRLIIFEDGSKIDFSFFDTKFLENLLSQKTLPDEYNRGYKILLDKDELTKNLPEPTFEGFKIKKPTTQEFYKNIDDFWFEVYHVAKYLARGDLWHAKWRDSDIKKRFLLKMIEWNEGSKNNWNHETNSIGKRMESWVNKNTWKSCFEIFSHFDAQDSWKALFKMMELYRKVAKETSQNLDFEYPEKKDQTITKLILDLKK